jgi:signal transduction histidine kinase
MTILDFLLKLPYFQELPEEDLKRFVGMVGEVYLQAGEQLFDEGDQGDKVYIIRDGAIEIHKEASGKEVRLAISQTGDVLGEMAPLVSLPRLAGARALTDSVLLEFGSDQLFQLISASPRSALSILKTVARRLHATQITLEENRRLAQLGQVAAGILHELNNPASAVRRGTAQLKDAFVHFRRAQANLSLMTADLPTDCMNYLNQLEDRLLESPRLNAGIGSLERCDLEDDLESWLDEARISDAWELAPILVNAGLSRRDLGTLAEKFPPASLPAALDRLKAAAVIASLSDEISQGASRISEIVRQIKTYARPDEDPVQNVDINASIENTLVILRHKVPDGIRIVREYDHQIPKLQAHGPALNQVWTNLIDNAIDALGESGEIHIRTRQEADWLLVEVEDNGPGIPPEVQPRLFQPFFTTKPIGAGLGLGLSTSYQVVSQHGGHIDLASEPGQTRFTVRLPLGDQGW